MGTCSAMTPHSLVFTPNNALANITYQAVFTPVHEVTITGVAIVAYNGCVGNNANAVLCKLVELANTSNVVATINYYATINATANTASELTINTTLDNVSAGKTLAAYVTFTNSSNTNFGTYWMAQIDYVQGSPGNEG